MPARVEKALLGQRAGGDKTHDGALQGSFRAALFRLGRILDLLADRHLESGADQPREIGFGRVHRHPAHRDVGAVVPAALGQRDVERRRGDDRVLEEQLVEIAHPEK